MTARIVAVQMVVVAIIAIAAGGFVIIRVRFFKSNYHCAHSQKIIICILFNRHALFFARNGNAASTIVHRGKICSLRARFCNPAFSV